MESPRKNSKRSLDRNQQELHMEPLTKKMFNKLTNFVMGLFDEEPTNRRNALKLVVDKCLLVNSLDVIILCSFMSDNCRIKIMNELSHHFVEQLSHLSPIDIEFFGSIMNGLALIDSDIDVYICQRGVRNQNPQELYEHISRTLNSSRHFSSVVNIRGARVPIIKTKHLPSGFNLDINVTSVNGVMNSNFINKIISLDVRLKKLFLFIKIWGKNTKIICREILNSYSLTTLIIFFLQQPVFNSKSILPAIRTMQDNIPENLENGVNYAFYLETYFNELPPNITVLDLVRKFFTFYANFDFKGYLIAPFLGTPLVLEDFKNKKITYDQYENQLKIMDNLKMKPVTFNFNVMHVQDCFELYRNLTNSISVYNLNYMNVVFKSSQQICCIDDQNSQETVNEIFKALIFDLANIVKNNIENLIIMPTNLKPNNSENNKILTIQLKKDEITEPPMPTNLKPKSSENNEILTIQLKKDEITEPPMATHSYAKMVFLFEPRKREIQWSKRNSIILNVTNWYYQWVHTYIAAIQKILTSIYLLDIQEQNDENIYEPEMFEIFKTKTWYLVGKTDLWTSRNYQHQSFWLYQKQQTDTTFKQRQSSEKYKVNLNCTVKLIAFDKLKGFKLVIIPKPGAVVSKFNNFFEHFTVIIRNYNIEEEIPE